jgi:UDP-N-acetyl-D-glucosamine dehydrogenase
MVSGQITTKELLLRKIESKEARIGIVGLGYVGLPLLLRFLETGFKVIGIDIDDSKVESLKKGQSYIKHVSRDRVAAAQASGRIEATTAFERAREADALIMCVPTPLDEHREPDLSYVVDTILSLQPYFRVGQVISLESTTYPRTTREELIPRVEKCGLKIGETAFVAFSPEREDPGNPHFHTATIPKVVGGATPACLEVASALYGAVISKVVKVSSPETAEMSKLLENIYRAVNIGLVNELKTVCDRMGIDIWEVIDAAATKPFGFTPFYPGPGLGGHCIPIDPFYLTWKAREYGVNTRFIELAGEVNSTMPHWVFSKVVDALNDHGKALKGSSVHVLGVAYKKNIDDVRESPAIELLELLHEKGCRLSYSDPYVPLFTGGRRYPMRLESTPVSTEVLKNADCVLVVTDHDAFDYGEILKHSGLIVDTRGRYRGKVANVVRA